ncbi:MAG: GNAT family N-acetyltransferase [Rhodobacteraceae bacterium]|nr:GNAT family N-acetyltransferase [Paracoccaceae bacterium]
MNIQGEPAAVDADRPGAAHDADFVIVPFAQAHADGVRALFIAINRELAPAGMEEAFSAYVERAIGEEIGRIAAYFDPAAGNGFWVVMHDGAVIGMFGLERQSAEEVELRRMYLGQSFRGRGLADRMLQRAEAEAARLGYCRLVLSTAEIQGAAVSFYRRSGFREVRREIDTPASHKRVGGGLTVFFFEKDLTSPSGSRQRIVRWSDPVDLAAAGRTTNGRDFLETVLRGELPLPPICKLVDFSFEEFGDGRAVMVLQPGEAHYNPIGSVHGGIIATVLDSVMGCAVHTKLRAGLAYSTLEIKVNYLRPITSASGPMRAVGTVVHAGRRTAMAESTLADAAGKIYAQASTTCLIFPLSDAN